MRFSKNALQRSVRSSGTKPSAPTATDPSVCTILSLFSIILVSSFLISYHITSYFLDPSSYLNEDDPEDWYDGDDPANWERFTQQLPSEQLQSSLRKYDSNKPPTLKQIYESRNCESYLAQIDEDGERIDSKSLPIYTDEQWQQFRNLWKEQGGKNAEEYYKKSDKRRSKAPPDFIPPVKAGQTKDGKGRGIFAARDIKKGEMTYGLSKNYIFFKSGNEFRRVLEALDDEKACDLMKFTWPQEGLGPKGEPFIWGPMDYAALMNHGEPDEVNTGCPRHVYCGNFDEYALRDIKEGEELLCDYGEFFDLNFLEFKKWKWFGL